jgi:hypothetical protein
VAEAFQFLCNALGRSVILPPWNWPKLLARRSLNWRWNEGRVSTERERSKPSRRGLSSIQKRQLLQLRWPYRSSRAKTDAKTVCAQLAAHAADSTATAEVAGGKML